jgi:hypothetical protein
MAIRAAQIGKDHQPRNLLRIRRRQTDGCQRAGDERFKVA